MGLDGSSPTQSKPVPARSLRLGGMDHWEVLPVPKPSGILDV